MLNRFALSYLLLTGLVVSVWALFLSHRFYTLFPGLGRSWVSIDGPYNEHLIRDVGRSDLESALKRRGYPAMAAETQKPPFNAARSLPEAAIRSGEGFGLIWPPAVRQP